MRRVLIFGATSAIAQETAKRFAADGDRIFLVARDEAKVRSVAQDLIVRGASFVDCAAADLNKFEDHEGLLEKAATALAGLDVVLIAHGSLPDQKACERSYVLAEEQLKTNFLSAVSLLTFVANRLERQKHGCIAVISSVAGDRGRPSNYIYGAAKGGLSLFLEGLRGRLHPAGVAVTTIKPGFVDTPMTAGIAKNFLFSSPEAVGGGVYRAILSKRECVYLPWFWRPIMLIIKSIPEALFKRLSL